MSQFSKPYRVKFSVSLATLVIALVVGLSGTTLWIIHRESNAASLAMTERLFDEIAAKLLEKSYALLDQTAALTEMGAALPSMLIAPKGNGLGHPALAFLLRALDSGEHLLSVYCGYGGGTLIKVYATRGSPAIISAFEAPAATRYIVQTISRGENAFWQEQWLYLDASHHAITERTTSDLTEDHRSSRWYIKAGGADQVVFTEPYLLSSLKVPGMSCARQFAESSAVFGADITLSQFSQFFWDQQVSEQGSAFLFDQAGRLLAHPGEPAVSVIRKGDEEFLWFMRTHQSAQWEVRSVASLLKESSGEAFVGAQTIDVQGRLHLTRLARLGTRWGLDQVVAVVAPVEDFTGHVERMQRRTISLSAAALIIAIIVALLLSHRVSRALRELAIEAERVQRFDFSEATPINSIIREIHALISAFSLMKKTIGDRTERLIKTQKKLKTLVDSGISLSSEREVNRLLEMIFLSSIELTQAEGGALFRMDEDEEQLALEIIRKGGESLSLNEDIHPGGTITFPVGEGDGAGHGDRGNAVLRVVVEKKPLTFTGTDAAPDKWLPSPLQGKYSTDFLLVVPLITSRGRIKGVLALMDPSSAETDGQGSFDRQAVEFAEALAAQAAAALDNRDLLASQERLMDAILKVMAGAIDAKSPHTGRHCARVPVVAELLAQAAHDSQAGPLAEFRFHTKEDWRAFEIAAWLHDCGKLTTPERVLDKATKLEMVSNRIHEVRARFEVLWRDAEIEMLKGILAGNLPEKELKKELAERHRVLQDDFSFIAACNLGGETITSTQLDRLQKVASQPLVRNFDNRLGLSQRELERMGSECELPVVECLLADKPEHLVPRGALNNSNADYGFSIEVPHFRFNHGELYNLSIGRGTLTPEERFIIQEHVMQTIIMLDHLPFPSQLREVPEYAGAHHEHMDGTGYPRGLAERQMSFPARMMAIADIFEALTSWDRPYKKAKPLSEALGIMDRMCDQGHLDRDLFSLFIQSPACLTYATKYLLPEQCDVTDFSQWLADEAMTA